jgi:hypothetical protein
MTSTPFLVSQENSIRRAAMCCLTVRRRRLALKDFDVCGNRDRSNVFEVLVTGTLSPSQELLDCPVVRGSCVCVPDRDRKELKEFFPGLWLGAGDESEAAKESTEIRTSIRIDS